MEMKSVIRGVQRSFVLVVESMTPLMTKEAKMTVRG